MASKASDKQSFATYLGDTHTLGVGISQVGAIWCPD